MINYNVSLIVRVLTLLSVLVVSSCFQDAAPATQLSVSQNVPDSVALIDDSSKAVVPFYAYQTYEPFETNREERRGLNFELMSAVNDYAGFDISFAYEPITRSELNERLSAGQPALVMWANPVWFKNIQQPLYWSKPLFWGESIMVTLKGRGLHFDSDEDVYVLTFGGRTGFLHGQIASLVAAKKVKRIDADSDAENVRNLLAKKVDVILITKARMLSIARAENLEGQLEVIPQPLRGLPRHILLTEHYKDKLDAINSMIDELVALDSWRARLGFYGFYYKDEPVNLEAN
jgi:ABC-type amino acid transport substrate-binding protein